MKPSGKCGGPKTKIVENEGSQFEKSKPRSWWLLFRRKPATAEWCTWLWCCTSPEKDPPRHQHTNLNTKMKVSLSIVQTSSQTFGGFSVQTSARWSRETGVLLLVISLIGLLKKGCGARGRFFRSPPVADFCSFHPIYKLFFLSFIHSTSHSVRQTSSGVHHVGWTTNNFNSVLEHTHNEIECLLLVGIFPGYLPFLI